MSAPFDVRPIIERLRAEVPMLRQVAGAADLAAVRSLNDFPTPCVYVLLARESYDLTRPGHAQRGTQVDVSQEGRISFGVVTVVRNYREQRGAQITDDLVTVLAPVRAALLGFVPDIAGARPCQLRQGDLTSYDAATAMWTDVWQTQQIIGA